MSKIGLLVELDALQDTALGVIAAHNQALGFIAVRDEEMWHNRVVEGIPKYLPPDVFDTLYSNRAHNALDVLGNSPLTGIPLMVGKFVNAHATNADARFYDSKLSIHVNIWPYDMTPSVKDILKRTVFTWFSIGPIVDLQIVRLSPEELTPQYLNGNYTQMYVRDIRPWFTAQAEMLSKYSIPLFTIVAPRIIRNTNKSEFDAIPSNKKDVDLFAETVKWHTGIIGLDFIDNKFFSYIPLPSEKDIKVIEQLMGEADND